MSKSLVHDEFPLIPIPDQKYWGENYVVAFYDPDTGIGGMLSMGRWVIRNRLWRNMSYIALPNDRVLVSRNMGPGTDPKVPDSGVFRLEIPEPGRKLRYVFDGPMEERTMTDLNTVGLQVGATGLVQFDFEFVSDAPIWDMHAGHGDAEKARSAEADFNSPDGHIEQNGRLRGTLTCGDGEIYSINAVATRDHSRGVRNMTRYKSHIWANGVFPSGRSFNIFSMKTQGFEGIAAGRSAAVVDGKLHEIKLAADSQGWLNQPDQLFAPVTLSYESDTLGRLEISATKLINSVPLMLLFPADHYWSVPAQARAKNLTWVNEQKVVWRWDGEEGWGHMERGNARFAATDPDWLSNFL
jgi:hypothetical protein